MKTIHVWLWYLSLLHLCSIDLSMCNWFNFLFVLSFFFHYWTSMMYWTNWNEKSPSISKSTIRGVNQTQIITDAIQTPNGLVIDHKSKMLYWSDARLDKIERCNTDGTHRVVRNNTAFPYFLYQRGRFLFTHVFLSLF